MTLIPIILGLLALGLVLALWTSPPPPTGTRPVARRLSDDLTLKPPHPHAGWNAWQCITCDGIFYSPLAPPLSCPYCENGDA